MSSTTTTSPPAPAPPPAPNIPWLDLKRDGTEITTSDGKRAFIPLKHGPGTKKLGYILGRYESMDRGYYSIETKQGHEILLTRLRRIEARAIMEERNRKAWDTWCWGCCDRPTSEKKKAEDDIRGKKTMRAFIEARLRESDSPVASVSQSAVTRYGGRVPSANVATWSPTEEIIADVAYFAYDIADLCDGGGGG